VFARILTEQVSPSMLEMWTKGATGAALHKDDE